VSEPETGAAPHAAAVVLATVPAAGLGCPDGTLLDRLTRQLDALSVPDVRVVARSVESVPAAGGGAGAAAATRGVVEDLRSVAKIARTSAGPVAVLPADLVAHTEALATLLRHPARDTGALVAVGERGGGPLRPAVRVEGGRIVAAGSSFHRIQGANATFRGVLQVGEADLGGLADTADELAELVEANRLGMIRRTEVADLLLVGLVRGGVPVRAAPLGRLHCERVAGQAAAESALTRLAGVDEARERLAVAVKSDDGFFATYFVSSWSRHLVRLAALLHVPPNTVTGISAGLALLAAVWFSAGTRNGLLLGALLLYLSFVFDCVDGQLARYTRTFSPLGAWLDAMCDRGKEYVVYIGLAAGYAGGLTLSGTGPDGIWALAVAAMVLQTLRHMIDFSYVGARADRLRAGPDGRGRPCPLAQAADPGAPQPGPRADDDVIVRLSRRIDRHGRLHWARKIIVLPIGERMALIAVTAAVWNARVTFLALLAWGGVAAAYSLAGRVARSLS
jgi:phosphatidylglycerophosphate synthase